MGHIGSSSLIDISVLALKGYTDIQKPQLLDYCPQTHIWSHSLRPFMSKWLKFELI